VFCCFLPIGTAHPRTGQMNIACFSIIPANRHSLHCAVVKIFQNSHVTCSWHKGTFVCEHRVLCAAATGISLTQTRAKYEENKRTNCKLLPWVVKPISSQTIPSDVDLRLVVQG
jgi:hypothetical protein